MKVAWYYGDSSQQELNTSLHRVAYPSKMLEEAGHECKIAHVSSLFASYDGALWADVIVIERLLMEETHESIRNLTLAGKKVFCTFDDAYHLMPGSVSRDVWRGGKKAREGKGSILNEFREGLRLCTGALVPSKLLAEDYRMYQPNIQYVPNYLYAPLWENLPPKNPDLIIIGWGGTTLHSEGWRNSGLIPALGKLCRKYPKVMVHIQPPYPEVVASMQKMGVRYALGTWEKFENWPKTVAKFHIGVAPLFGEYDRRRSMLKGLEFAMVGAPWVATDSNPYQEARGGILVNNKSSEFYSALDELISNRALYKNLSEEGHEWATEFNNHCAERYLEVFNG